MERSSEITVFVTTVPEPASPPGPTTPPPLPAAVYLGSLGATSRRTMAAALRAVVRALGSPGNELTFPWASVDYVHMVAIRSRLAAAFAPSTSNRALSAVRGVLKAAVNLQLMDAAQMVRACAIKAVPGCRVPPGRSLSETEIGLLIGACDTNTAAGARDAAVLSILFAGGLRRSEVVNLDLADVDLVEGRLRVHGKGSKERIVYMPKTCLPRLQAWLAYRGMSEGPLVVPTTRKRAITGRRLTDQSIAAITRRLAHRANVSAFSPHDARRTLIGDLLDHGIDLATVQRWVGHADPATTSRYDRRGDRALRRAAQCLDSASWASAAHGV